MVVGVHSSRLLLVVSRKRLIYATMCSPLVTFFARCLLALAVAPRLILSRVFWNPSDWELEYKSDPTAKLCTDVVGFIAFVSMGVYVVARTVLWKLWWG